MIVMPNTPGIRKAVPREIDYGITQRPPLGAPSTRITRGGTRLAARIEYPDMSALDAMAFISRLRRGREEGVRIRYPLAGVDQSGVGAPTVNGSGAAGTSLPVTGATPGATVREGFWLTVRDAAGNRYLHTVSADVVLVSGSATLPVWPPLRAVLASGSPVEFAAPTMEGWVVSEISWPLPHTRIVSIGFDLEEAQ